MFLSKVSLTIKWSLVALCALSYGLSWFEFFSRIGSPILEEFVFLVLNMVVQLIGIKGVYTENCKEIYLFAILLFNSLIMGHIMAVKLFYMTLVTFVLMQLMLVQTMLLKGEQSSSLPK